MRPRGHRLQLVSQPALPQVPGLAAGARGWSARRPTCCRWTTTSGLHPAPGSRGSGDAKPAAGYTLLFAASETMREVAADRSTGGRGSACRWCCTPGARALHSHPHVHGVATGGGLSCDRRGEAERRRAGGRVRPGLFLPVRVLSRLFRGKFLAGLRGPDAKESSASSAQPSLAAPCVPAWAPASGTRLTGWCMRSSRSAAPERC